MLQGLLQMSSDAAADAIEMIYRAAVEPGLWVDVLTWMSRAFGARCATIIPLTHSFSLMASPGVEEAQRVYAQSWWTADTMIEDMRRKSFPVGFYNDWEQIAAEHVARDAYYQDFRAAFGMGGMMGTVTKPHPGETFAIGLQLAVKRDLPDAAQIRRFEVLARHLSRAVAIAARMASLEDRCGSLAEALSVLDHGVAIVARSGRVLMANAALSAMDGDGLRVERGGLRCARPADQAVLDRLIAGSLSDSVIATGPDHVAVTRRSGRHPLLVRAIPLRRSPGDRPFLMSDTPLQVLVLVIDPDKKSGNPIEQALQLLGLTRSEARVAALVGAGMSPGEAAPVLGLTRETVRSHLKHAFDKLGLHRQAELVALAGRLAKNG